MGAQCSQSERFNQLMYDRQCAIHEEICEFTREHDTIWLNEIVIPSVPFVDGEGVVKEKVRHHGAIAPQMPLEDVWEDVGLKTDTNPVPPSDPAWDPDLASSNCNTSRVHDLTSGLENFTYRPKTTCLRGEEICSEDVRFGWKFEQILGKHSEHYALAGMELKTMWNRDTYLMHAQRYPAVEDLENLNPVTGVLPPIPPGGLLPLQICLFDRLYEERKIRFGRYATGRTKGGNPSFLVLLNANDMTAMLRRQFGEDAFRNSDVGEFFVEGIGEPRMYGNWSFMSDDFMPRYREDPANPGQLERVYPWEVDPGKANITGTAYRLSDAWKNAPYAEAAVFMTDVFQNQIFPTISSIAGAQMGTADNGFIDWDGMPLWAKTGGECDPHGLIGRYYMYYKRAAEPGCNEGAFSIIYSRCDFCELDTTCLSECATPCDPVDPVFVCQATGANELTITVSQDLGFEVGQSVDVDVEGVGVITGTITSATSTSGFVYVIDTSPTTAECGTGINSIVLTPAP